MNESDELKEILHERHDLRIEMIELQNGSVKAVLLFTMLALGSFGIGLEAIPMGECIPREHLFVALTQVEYFIGLFVLLLLSNLTAR